MKRLIPFLVSLGVFAIGLYLSLNNMITSQLYGVFEYIVYGVTLGSAMLAGLFFLFFLGRKKDKKITWLKNRLEQWSNLSVHVNKAGDEVFSELPIGILIYDDSYDVKWINKYAKTIFDVDLIEKNIDVVNKGLYKELQNGSKKFTVSVNEQFYEVIHMPDNRIIYMFDVTEREVINTKYFDSTPALGLIALDNFDSETKSFDLQETTRIKGLYFGKISEWAEKFHCYLKNNDDDSLMIIAERSSLLEMMQDKFSVLESIREISTNNGIRVTMSLGIACWNCQFAELGSYAQNAIDLAEKRGGDQVVVNIQNEKVQYFGAKSNALEKNDLVSARAHTMALKEEIEKSSNVYVMAHNVADADALGATIGALRLVLASNKPGKAIIDAGKVDITCQQILSDIEEIAPELASHFVNSAAVNDINADSLLIVVDTQSPRIVMSQEFYSKFKRVAVIDHHRSSDEGFLDPVMSYVEPYASSTVELITEMLMFYNIKDKVKISPYEATVMLAGLVVDTNNFTFRCGTRTFEAASTLREYGADMVEIRRLLRNDYSTQMLIAKCLENVEIVLDHFAICVLDERISDKTLLAKISESILNINNVEASFTIAQYDPEDSMLENSQVAISARSYRDINVQVIMEEMGGGGHLNSAASQIRDTNIETVKGNLISILKRDYEIGDEVMKVILLEDVKGRGVKDQIIEVAVGYGNYLISNKKGVLATDDNIQKLKEAQQQALIEEENQKKLMQKIKQEIEEKCVNIYIKLGADGKPFGHVTTKQICEEFEAQTGIHIDKRKVELPVDINALGVFTATVSLHKDIVANLEINVLEK